MQDGKKLAYYFKRYSKSLQTVVYQRTGNYFYGKGGKPVPLVYLCPLCLRNTISYDGEDLRYKEEFTLDHFPPESVGGKDTVLVCKACNSTSGDDFDYSLKQWIHDQSAANWTPNARVPVKLELEGAKGKYNAHLVIKAPFSFEWQMGDYPLVKEWFDKIKKGEALTQTIKFQNPAIILVYKALLKAAYLYCFSVWGYDFIFTETAQEIRDVLFKNKVHILSNWGIFFHSNDQNIPDGLGYVFKPLELQSFIINVKLINKDVKFHCGVSVLIPGAEVGCWTKLKSYQPIIDEKNEFQQALIQLPEDSLTNNNLFPYTKTWNERATMKILGESF
jgi:hypothetical protein